MLDYIIMPNKFAHKKVRKLYIYTFKKHIYINPCSQIFMKRNFHSRLRRSRRSIPTNLNWSL